MTIGGASSKLWTHVLALGVILCALVPLLDNGAVVSADEGAVLSQVEILHSTGNWALPNPAASIDPEGRWFGIDISDQNGDDFFPYAKHAVYPATAWGLSAIGGHRLVLVASALGTLAAALFAALIARRVAPVPRLDIATLWVVGIVSPLFFDSFWVIAHSIGAAFATGAALAAVKVVEDRRAWALAPLAVGVAGAALYRSEGMLYGIALAGGCGLVGILRRDRLAVVAAFVSGGVATGAWWLDSKLYSRIVGTAIAPFAIHPQSTSWIGGRLQGIWASLLRPQLLASTAAGAIFLAIALLGVVAAAYVRFRPTETRLIQGIAIVCGVSATAALFLRPAPVPGLLIAFPLLPIALVLAGREQWRPTAATIVGVTGALYAGAVVATQYPVGGSMEWGGRFFHLALPGVVPVLLAALLSARRRLDDRTARLGTGALGIVSVVLLVFSIGSIVRIHTVTDELVDGLVTLSESTSDARDGHDGPVVVSNMEAVGRLSWKGAVHGRYLRVTERRDLAAVADRLDRAGVDEFVFAAAFDHERDRARLDGYAAVPDRTVVVGQWKLYLMRREAP